MTPDKPSLKERLADFAKEKYPTFVNGGDFETFSITLGFKASNGSRRCRELADEGTLERRINGKSVEYRYLQKQVQKNPASIYKCTHCSKDAVKYLGHEPRCPQHLPKAVNQLGLL